MRARFLTALLAALVLLPALPARADTPELPDRIAAAWRTDHVWVDPRLAGGIPATELARARAAMRTAGMPVYVAIVPWTPPIKEAGYNLPTLLHARIGTPGLYLLAVVNDTYWSITAEMYRPGGLHGRDLVSVQNDDKQRLDVVTDRPAPSIVRTIQEASTALDGRALPTVPVGDRRPPSDYSDHGLSGTDKADRAAYVGMGIGGVLGFALTLLLGLRRRRRTAKQSDPPAKDEPPVDAWDVELKADDKIKAAEGAVARLDKRRNRTTEQLDQRDDAYRRLDAARTLRADHPDDLLAAAGALVLARQAERVASGAALQPPCFFDPRHNPGTATVDWSDDVEVPACQQCASVVRRGKTPRGLRVVSKRKQVPYWTLDPDDNPMVASGFGALSDDLPERVAAWKDKTR